MKNSKHQGHEFNDIIFEYVKNNQGLTAYEIYKGTALGYYKIRMALPRLCKTNRIKYTEKFEDGSLTRRYFINS